VPQGSIPGSGLRRAELSSAHTPHSEGYAAQSCCRGLMFSLEAVICIWGERDWTRWIVTGGIIPIDDVMIGGYRRRSIPTFRRLAKTNLLCLDEVN